MDESDIGMKGLRPGRDLGGVLRFPHHAQVVLNGKELLEAQTENGLPIRHQYAYFPLRKPGCSHSLIPHQSRA